MCVGLERKKSGAFNPMVSTDGIVYRDSRTLCINFGNLNGNVSESMWHSWHRLQYICNSRRSGRNGGNERPFWIFCDIFYDIEYDGFNYRFIY